MFKLQNCKFTGLPGIQDLEIDLSRILTLTGPNGTGKSTVLEILSFTFRIIEECEVSDTLPQHDPWHVFKTATLQFECVLPVETHLLGPITTVTLFIECNSLSYHIAGISTNAKSLLVTKPALRAEIENWKELVTAAKKQIEIFDKEVSASPSHLHLQVRQQQAHARSTAAEQEKANSALISKTEMLSVDFEENDITTSALTRRSDLTGFLKELNLPATRHINTQQLMQQDIPSLIKHLIELKKGGKKSAAKFRISEERLNKLLQSEIDVFENDNDQALLINGISYKKASTGTYLTLSFFALTESEDPNKIVLWDEPENGLHPTRRVQLLDLMRVDGRQFIIATHATEFAPVMQVTSKVYRCVNNYNEETSEFRFSVIPVATRRDAFSTLEALGIHPARTLFTANVVIWVEGPTELLFYRHWLTRRLEKDGYQEGLHYSIMQYGGSLINYLAVADNLHLTSTFDLLSHCRHPVVLVDSDIKEKTQLPLEESLKTGAQRILSEIKKLNTERRGAALFQATQGREIENYLPKAAIWHAIEVLWTEFSQIKGNLSLDQIDLSQYRKYSDALLEFFENKGIIDSKNLPRGRSIWGANNKVGMMTAALSMPNFEEDQLELNCSQYLDEIDKFIRSKHDVEYPNGLK